MKKIIRTFLSFVPAICIACMIFYFSGQTGNESSTLSKKVTEEIVLVIDHITDNDWSEEELGIRIEEYEHYVRKAAHMTEYAIFAISVMLPLRFCGFKGAKLFFLAMLICCGFAASDEFHQLYVGGRAGTFKDVCIDSIGACIGCGISGIVIKLVTRVKN